MPLTKIAAVILLIGAGTIGFFLINKNFFSAERQEIESPVSISQPESGAEEFSKKTKNSPLYWLKTEDKNELRGESSENKSGGWVSSNEFLQKTESKLKDFVGTFQVSVENQPAINPSVSSQEDKSKETEEYFKNFAVTLQRVNFTSEEISAIKNDQNNRILLLEELLEQAEQNTDLNELKNSFVAWHRFDNKALEEFNKIIPSSETAAFHQTIIDWFNYHSSVAEKFSEEELSQSQISKLVQNFEEKAGIHNQKLKQNQVNLQQSLNQDKTLFGLLNFLKPTAQAAVTCGAIVPPPFYHFGGRTTLPVPCCQGLVIAITPPCGGLLYFHYAVIAANPYLFKNLEIPGVAIIGKSVFSWFPDCLWGTGYCGAPTCIPVPCSTWYAFVIYFGTAALP